ncbi:uncharacterized protein F5147DRAFT_653959 [Suillus discolor]|uniref:Uncharacterized protein n=1 Tax=Suillus discolor TaxID=1912936 RepID=A0A9P7JSH5_9AGAM|nr:uncharacterized protein F5147DRAFT_653959 [Suillus discolor]KAG2106208.1 hypothetical protein F5147DRAFT_653959 [Suillus discolor]
MWSWDTQPNSHAQRKFIELILDRTGKYPNWDPPSEIPDHLIDAGINIESGEHLPEECPEEPEFTTWSKNVKQIELNVDSQTNQVKKGTTGAVLLMNKPRTKRITSDAVGKLAKLQLFQSMRLVTKAVYCPAFSMYLSDTREGGESFSIALLGSAPIAEPVGTVDSMATMRWWSDTQTGLTRNGCKTEHCYSPLYELLHVRHPRNRRATPSPIRTSEMLWIASPVPWAPLREDGTEVPIYIQLTISSTKEFGFQRL